MLCCKGWKSKTGNPLLKQHDSRIVCSRMNRHSRKEDSRKSSHTGRDVRYVRADTTAEGLITPSLNTSGNAPQKGEVMEITYTKRGDYLIPDIILSDPPNAPPLGLYGMKHKEYLREYKPALYASLLLSEKLYPLCRRNRRSGETPISGNRKPRITREAENGFSLRSPFFYYITHYVVIQYRNIHFHTQKQNN